MVIEVMRERMRLGLVMGDHPSIAGRSKVLGRRNICEAPRPMILKRTTNKQRTSARHDRDPDEGSSRVE